MAGERARLPNGGLLIAGAACLLATVVLGVAVGTSVTPVDRAVAKAVHHLLRGHHSLHRPIAIFAAERGDHGVYITALLPIVVAAAVQVWDSVHGHRMPVRRLAWLLPLVLAVPLDIGLRLVFHRAGPLAAPPGPGQLGSYPSGAAVVVAGCWTVGVAALIELRPRWRVVLVVVGAVVLLLHLGARVDVNAHWATDIVGSYLLVAGLALCGAGAIGRGRSSPAARVRLSGG